MKARAQILLTLGILLAISTALGLLFPLPYAWGVLYFQRAPGGFAILNLNSPVTVILLWFFGLTAIFFMGKWILRKRASNSKG